jgi:cytokinesis protein
MQVYLEEMVRTYDDIMVFYGEDASDENARRDFFSKLAIFVTEWKKSKEKNIQLEETRRRNEASMKRKHAQLKVNGMPDSGAPLSPSSTGAMDSLLEKLRAAAPQTRDQRDRRRRARLQNKHQVRIASGQKIPDPDEIPEVEESLKRVESAPSEGNPISPDASTEKAPSDSKDNVAERAALLLQGMRGTDGAEDGDPERRESARRSRRRETAEEERKARRRRRERGGAGASEALGDGDQIPGEGEVEDDDREKIMTPTTVISPPSPGREEAEGSAAKPVEIDD